ncbi:ComF family protein [Tropicimonas sp. IMCC34011]|uniref:ComF family protein n=1 Tax=Tropicimonas sp. IMCC34011 TaxID=2248759 RepID=UPI000E2242A0|nr:ComF family protein [Tropicimonas sp. IMCC34011]
MQTLLSQVYPPHCLCCPAPVADHGGLCAGCWSGLEVISGAICELCGAPVGGEEEATGAICDACLSLARPWARGRAALVYGGSARRIVLGLKHGDRTELARPAGRWMAAAGADLLSGAPLIAPIPLHWTRLAGRRYNQAALLAQSVARHAEAECVPDLLTRTQYTPTQAGRGYDGRFANVMDRLALHPRRGGAAEGRDIVLVDDVMTSGATFAAATEACLAGGAASVSVLALARALPSA